MALPHIPKNNFIALICTLSVGANGANIKVLVSMSNSAISLETLIGDTSDIKCQENFFNFKGLSIATFSYSIDDPKVLKGVIIAIHGGPAFCHNYILPLKLLARDGYKIIFYDQAGCGKSSYIKDPDGEAPWLLTLEYYLDELQALINFFNLDNYFVYGSSWVNLVLLRF